jgi:muramoyltetrapeptide carboxypeptidase
MLPASGRVGRKKGERTGACPGQAGTVENETTPERFLSDASEIIKPAGKAGCEHRHVTKRPAPLQRGSHVRVIAPSRSLAMISAETRAIADRRLVELGLRVSFGSHVEEVDEFVSTSVNHRVRDLHEAFADPSVDGILTVIGGYNSNQLLEALDWDLIAAHPKTLCGYSDITALTCAIHAHTGLITYSGPHYSTFGMEQHFETTRGHFVEALFHPQRRIVEHATSWTDDAWFIDQANRTIRPTDGPWVLSEGTATGKLIGGNLCTLNLLQGTSHMPSLESSVLFIEDDSLSFPENFDRDLTSLSQQPDFDGVQAILIGRFQAAVEMTRAKLQTIIDTNERLAGVPVVANLDFGHTDPILTVPIGGQAWLDATDGRCRLEIA